MFWTATDDGAARAPEDDFWYTGIPYKGANGPLNPDAALSLPAVYSAGRVISEAIMQIPLLLYRRTEDGGKERATDHPLFSVVHRGPNDLQTAAEWREVMQHHLLFRGNAYCQIFDDGRKITELGMPIHPDLVRPTWVQPGSGTRSVVYQIRQNGKEVPVPQSDIFHLRGIGVANDGLEGLNPIQLERQAIGVGLTAQEFTGRFLENDATPGGYLTHPGQFKSDEQRTKFKKSWHEAQSGWNRGKLAVLEYGMSYTPVDLKLVDAQFLETRKYTNLDICRIFRVPPHLIMELDRATFSNITQQDIEFVKFTMLPWLVRWEQRLSKQLLTDEEQNEYFFEFLVDGLERGDGEARSAYYKAGIQDGWLTRNEVRRRENLNPLEGLDEPLEPMNMRNPGGENDERLSALKLNAARACARKQRHLLTAAPDAAEFLLNDAKRVKQFMECSTSKAQNVCSFVAGMVATDQEMNLDLDAWEARQVRLLVEMT